MLLSPRMGPLVYITILTYLAPSALATGPGHRTFQYNVPTNDRGEYNFAYDTGSQNAHSTRMEYRDDSGTVRGRYGYTDPRGKLRIVEYEAGPLGYKARGDVGPDGYYHGDTPIPESLKPIQEAGWDPDANPINSYDKFSAQTNLNIAEGTIDHPIKGYDRPRRPVHIAVEPMESLKHHSEKGYTDPKPIALVAPQKSYQYVEKSIHEPVPIAVEPIRSVDHHPEKGYAVPKPAVVVVSRKSNPYVEKSIHAPVPVAVEPIRSREHHHLAKGYPAPKPISLVAPQKSHNYVEKSIHAPVPIAVEPIKSIDHHPEKGYAVPKPAAVVVSRKSNPYVEKSIHAPAPVAVEPLRSLEHHHPPKGYPPPKPISLVAPQKSHHYVEKSIHAPVPIAVEPIKSIDHHPEKGYGVPKPAAVVVSRKSNPYVEKSIHAPEPVAVEPIRSLEHHHPEKAYADPKPIVAINPGTKTDYYVEKSHHSSLPSELVVIDRPKGHKVETYHHKPSSEVVSSLRRDDHHHHVNAYRSPSPLPKYYHDNHHVHAPKLLAAEDHHNSPKSKVYSISESRGHIHSRDEEGIIKFKTTGGEGASRYTHTNHSPQHPNDYNHHHHSSNSGLAHSVRAAPVTETKHEHRHVSNTSEPLVTVKPLFVRVKPYHEPHIHEDVELVRSHAPHKSIEVPERYAPLTVRNIDVDPDEIRIASPNRSGESEAITDLPIATADVLIRDSSARLERLTNEEGRSPSPQHGTLHLDPPRQVVYRSRSRTGRGSFAFE